MKTLLINLVYNPLGVRFERTIRGLTEMVFSEPRNRPDYANLALSIQQTRINNFQTLPIQISGRMK